MAQKITVALEDDLDGGPADETVRFGLRIQHPLTGRQQLLGQQVPQAGGTLDSPGPLRPLRRPRQQMLRLSTPLPEQPMISLTTITRIMPR
jgi:hypothetical protein